VASPFAILGPLEPEAQAPGVAAGAAVDPDAIWRLVAQSEPSLLERLGGGFSAGLSESIFAPALRHMTRPGVEGLERRQAFPGVIAHGRPEAPGMAERVRAFDEARAAAGIERPGLDIAADALALTAGMLAGDLPTFFVPGGLIARSVGVGRRLAAATGATGGRAALVRAMTEAGALFGTGEGLREGLKQAFGEAPEDPGAIVAHAARGLATGAALGATHRIPNALLRLAGEYATFAGLAPGLEGRLPTREDLWGAGAMVLGFRALDLVMRAASPTPGADREVAVAEIRRLHELAARERQLSPEVSAGARAIEGAFRAMFEGREGGMSELETQLAAKLARAEFVERATSDPEYLGNFSPEAVQRAQERFIREFTETKLAETEMGRFLADQFPSGKPAAPMGRQVLDVKGGAPERLQIATTRGVAPEARVGEVIRRRGAPTARRTEAIAEVSAGKLPDIVGRGPAPPAAAPPATPAPPAATPPATPPAAPAPNKVQPPTEDQLVRARVHINRQVPQAERGAVRKLLAQLAERPEGFDIQAALADPRVRTVLESGGWTPTPFVGEVEAMRLPRSPAEAGYVPAAELRSGEIVAAPDLGEALRSRGVLASQVARVGYTDPRRPELGLRPTSEVSAEIVQRLGTARGLDETDIAAAVGHLEARRLERQVLEDLTAGSADPLQAGPAPEVSPTMQAYLRENERRRGDVRYAAAEPPPARPEPIHEAPPSDLYSGPLGVAAYENALRHARAVSEEIAMQLHERAWVRRYQVARRLRRPASGEPRSSSWETLAGGRGTYLSDGALAMLEKLQRHLALSAVSRQLKVETPLDFAVLGQLFGRNDAFEQFGTAYFKEDGTLVHIELTTMRLPSSTAAFEIAPRDARKLERARQQGSDAYNMAMRDLWMREFERLEARRRQLGADYIANFHNHPSSAAAASPADMIVVRLFERYVPTWRYHVIFDEGHFGLMHRHRGGSAAPVVVPLPAEVARNGRLIGVDEAFHEMLGMGLNEPAVVALVADQFGSSQRHALIFYRDNGSRLAGVQRMPASTLQRIGYEDQHSEGFLRRLDRDVIRQGIRRFQADDAIVFYDGKVEAVGRGMLIAVEHGVFASAVSRYLDAEGNVIPVERRNKGGGLSPAFEERLKQLGKAPRPHAILRRHRADDGAAAEFAVAEMREQALRDAYKAGPDPDALKPPPRVPAKARLGGNNPRGSPVPVEEGKPFAGRYESDWAAGPRELREAMLDLIGSQQEWQRRGTLTRAQVTKLAERLHIRSRDIDHLLGKQGTILPVEHQEAFVTEFYRLDKVIEDLSAKAQQAAARGDIQEKLRLESEIENAADLSVKLWMTVQASRSEAGRTLGAGARRPGFMRAYAASIRAVLDERRLSPEAKKRMIEAIVRARSPLERRAAIEEAYIPDVWDKLFELRVGFLLSSPVTMLERNPVGNAAAAVTRYAETVAGIGFDLLFDAAGIGRASQGRRTPAEAMWDLYGLWNGLKVGAQMFIRGLADEGYAMSRGGKAAEVGVLGAIKPDLPGTGLSRFGRLNQLQEPVGKIVRSPMRVVAATDMLFASVNKVAEVYKRASRQATLEGVTGVDRARRINEIADQVINVDADRLAELVNDISLAESAIERIAAESQLASKEFIFQRELGNMAKRVDALRFATIVNPVTGRPHKANLAKLLRFFIPFLPMPINILKFTAERTPVLGAFTERNRAIWEAFKNPRNVPREDLVDAWARMAVGTAIFVPFVLWALEGNITGAAPDNPSAKALWERFNQAHSIRIDGRWYSYRGLSPLSEMMAAAAEIANGFAQDGRVPDADLIGRVGLAIGQTFLDQPFLTGVNDVLTALMDRREGERRATTALGSAVSSTLVPRLATFVARSLDPERRAFPETVMERLRQDVPGLRSDAVPLRDPIGRKFSAESVLHQVANAWLYTKESASRSRADHLLWLASDMPHRALVNYPSRRQLGRKLTPEEYDEFLAKRGEILEPMLERLGASPAVLNIARRSKPAIQRIIRDAVEDATLVAKVRVLVPRELERLGLEDTRANRARLIVLLRTPRLRDAYESPEASDEDRVYLLATGRPAPGSHLLAPETPGEVAAQ